LARIEGFPLERVRSARFAVVGAGAVGNELVKNLALLGSGTLDIFDLDRIESHNLTRSIFFREADVGQWKATVLADRASAVDPSCAVRGVAGDFRDTLRLRDLAGYDAAFACVDSLEARIALSQMCRLVATPLVNTGVDSRFVAVEVFPFGVREDSACYECHLPESAYARLAERYSCGWLRKRAWASQVVPTSPITASIAGAHAAAAALQLVGGPIPSGASRLLVDAGSGHSTRVELTRESRCAGCAGAPDRPPLIFAKRSLHDLLGGGLLPPEAELRLSDPVIAGGGCVQCGTGIGDAYVLQRASRFDDTLSVCPRCQVRSMRVEIRDLFIARELFGDHANDANHAGRALDTRFVLADTPQGTLCIELEDDIS